MKEQPKKEEKTTVNKPRQATDPEPAKYAKKWNQFYNLNDATRSPFTSQVMQSLNKDMGSQKSFELIYEKGYWDGSKRHPSRAGSVPETNIDYLLLVQQLIDHLRSTK